MLDDLYSISLICSEVIDLVQHLVHLIHIFEENVKILDHRMKSTIVSGRTLGEINDPLAHIIRDSDQELRVVL